MAIISPVSFRPIPAQPDASRVSKNNAGESTVDKVIKTIAYTPIIVLSALSGIGCSQSPTAPETVDIGRKMSILKSEYTALEQLANDNGMTIDQVTNCVVVVRDGSVTKLDLSHTDVSNINALRDLNNLYAIDLSYTKVTDISIFKSMTVLSWVILSHTGISDVCPLQWATGLGYLDITGDNVTDTSCLMQQMLYIKKS
jgi:hypothetical protein